MSALVIPPRMDCSGVSVRSPRRLNVGEREPREGLRSEDREEVSDAIDNLRTNFGPSGCDGARSTLALIITCGPTFSPAVAQARAGRSPPPSPAPSVRRRSWSRSDYRDGHSRVERRDGLDPRAVAGSFPMVRCRPPRSAREKILRPTSQIALRNSPGIGWGDPPPSRRAGRSQGEYPFCETRRCNRHVLL